MQKLLTTFIAIIFAATLNAAEWIKLDRMDLYVDTPKKWLIKEKLLGFPLVLVSPSKNGQRASLSFTPSSHKEVPPSNLKDFNDQFHMYKNGRSKWLKEREGQLVRFIEPSVKKYDHIQAGIVGLEYKLGETSFVEYSINIFCDQRFIFSKLLYSKVDHPNAYNSTIDVLKSMQCRSKQ